MLVPVRVQATTWQPSWHPVIAAEHSRLLRGTSRSPGGAQKPGEGLAADSGPLCSQDTGVSLCSDSAED